MLSKTTAFYNDTEPSHKAARCQLGLLEVLFNRRKRRSFTPNQPQDSLHTEHSSIPNVSIGFCFASEFISRVKFQRFLNETQLKHRIFTAWQSEAAKRFHWCFQRTKPTELIRRGSFWGDANPAQMLTTPHRRTGD